MHWLARFAVTGCLAVVGCSDPDPVVTPVDRAAPKAAPELSVSDQELLASLSTDDPGDLFDARARLWRIGAIRWTNGGAELGGRPTSGAALAAPLGVVVVEPVGPRILLPLDQLEWHPPARELVGVVDRGPEVQSPEPIWHAIRVTAIVGAGDLVAGLRRDLAPTPWLELAAGIPLAPLDGEGDRLRVGWDDPECGFGLTLAIDPGEFGPLHQTTAPAEAPPAVSLRLEPGAAVFESPEQREPLLRLDAASTLDPEGPGWVGQEITRTGGAKRGRTPIILRCHGVTVRGWVESKLLHESPGRYAFVEEAELPAISSCAGRTGEPMVVPVGTALYGGDAVVGVVVEQVAMVVSVEASWFTTCVPSPWGDLELRFRSLR